MKKWICFLAFLILAGIGPVASGISVQAQAKPDDTIMEGVYAGEISLAGMTQTEAQEAVQAYVDSLGSSVITLKVVEDVYKRQDYCVHAVTASFKSFYL